MPLTTAATVVALNPLDPHSLLSSLGAVGVFLPLRRDRAAHPGVPTGFFIGRKAGPPLLDRAGQPRLRRAAGRAQVALERYGTGKAIVLARFVPLVRTVLKPLAGALRVPARTLLLWQVLGGLLWSSGVTLAGYALGSRIPNIDHYLLPIILLPIIAVIIVVSLIPVLVELRRASGARKSA